MSLLGALADLATTADLLAGFRSWRGQAFSDDAALQVARGAAVVLGQLGAIADAAVATDVADTLLDAACDGAFAELQSAAAAGLGELGARCPAAAKPLLGELARSDEAAVAHAAQRALASCGR
ncbi:MAG: hypothetical protein H6709_13895 [Kofleriaceae bacterium]|nr:hypothetical protein [Kofleriaceae bacterium]